MRLSRDFSTPWRSRKFQDSSFSSDSDNICNRTISQFLSECAVNPSKCDNSSFRCDSMFFDCHVFLAVFRLQLPFLFWKIDHFTPKLDISQGSCSLMLMRRQRILHIQHPQHPTLYRKTSRSPSFNSDDTRFSTLSQSISHSSLLSYYTSGMCTLHRSRRLWPR